MLVPALVPHVLAIMQALLNHFVQAFAKSSSEIACHRFKVASGLSCYPNCNCVGIFVVLNRYEPLLVVVVPMHGYSWLTDFPQIRVASYNIHCVGFYGLCCVCRYILV